MPGLASYVQIAIEKKEPYFRFDLTTSPLST